MNGRAEGAVLRGGWTRRAIATYLLKRRVVMAYRELPAATVTPNAEMGVCIYSGATPLGRLPPHQVDALADTVGAERLERRLLNEDVTLVLGVDRQTQAPIGFRWVVHPATGTAWHDNVPIRPGEALGFNAFVYPQYRGRGFYQRLVVEGNRYLMETLGYEKVTIVVEATNEASLAANRAAGLGIEGENYLAKWLGRNAFSIFRDRRTGRWSVYYVLHGKGATL